MITELIYFVKCNEEPGLGCLITTASIFMASIFCTVSLKLSPFFRLLEEAEKLTVSALKRFWANSKLILVRVEFSKKRFTIVFPCKEGTFFIGRSRISLKLKDVLGREVIQENEALFFIYDDGTVEKRIVIE